MLNNLSPSRFIDWLTIGQYSLKSLSVLRILYGIAFIVLLVPSMSERSLLWGEASFWVDPEAKRRGYWTFDTLFTKDSALLFDIAYFALIALAVLFVLGWRARLVTPVLLLLYVSLSSNNSYLLNGGDTLMRITLLFLVFANLSEHYSLDSRRRRRSTKPRKRLLSAHVVNSMHNSALILSCFQILVVYTTSGIWKFLGDDWLTGEALFYALRLDNFMLYPAINELIWQSSLVIYAATYISLLVQTFFPVLILWRPTRVFTLISLIFMHLSIGIFLGLWPFSLAMIALDMLFIRDSTWRNLGEWLVNTKAYDRGRSALSRAYRRLRPTPFE